MKNKIKHFLDLIKIYRSYKKQRLKCTYFPIRLWIEPTSMCNLKCSLCPNKDMSGNQKGLMDFELFKKIIDEVSTYAYDINLFHRGESLLHADIVEMIQYAKSRGVYTRIHTNGTLLTESLSRQIFNSGLDFLSFSFDSYDKKLYETNRVNSDFDKTLSNIVTFLEMKKKLKRKKPFTVLQFMEYSGNSSKIQESQKDLFISRFKQLPLNKIIVRQPHNWAGNISNITKEDLISRKKHLIPCTFLWYSATIFWDGSVVPCPQDFNGEMILGNMQSQSLSEIWEGEKIQDLRRRMHQKSLQDDLPCAKCDRIWRNTFCGVPTDYLAPFLRDNIKTY